MCVCVSGATRICLRGGSKHEKSFIAQLNTKFQIIRITYEHFITQYLNTMTVIKKRTVNDSNIHVFELVGWGPLYFKINKYNSNT